MSDGIEHVICLMLENRSFDQMLGGSFGAIPGIDAVNPQKPGSNTAPDGSSILQSPNASPTIAPDPKHETVNVLKQLENNNGRFVEDYAAEHKQTKRPEWEQVMAYFPWGELRPLHTLARNFVVCDKWFSSVPGPTWTNRLFMHSGTSKGRVKMPAGPFNLNLHRYDQVTVYDRLREAGQPWAIYYGDVPHSLILLRQWRRENKSCYHRMKTFYEHAAGPAQNFPRYSFIEPRYFMPGQNDDHPPHDSQLAQALIANVYNAIRANEELWKSSLLVITYDEHGGFYDHVSPPGAMPPDTRNDEYDFDRLGVRVPAVLVSPLLNPGVNHDVLDHTSLLKYLTNKWDLGPLGNRTTFATPVINNENAAVRLRTSPRPDCPPSLPVPGVQNDLATDPSEEFNENQRALLAFSEVLEEAIPPSERKAVRSFAMIADSRSQVEAAKERVTAFLAADDMTLFNELGMGEGEGVPA